MSRANKRNKDKKRGRMLTAPAIASALSHNTFPRPPQLTLSFRFPFKMRYFCSNNLTAVNIFSRDLLTMFAYNTTSLLVNYRLVTDARLKKVELWSPSTAGNTVTASIEWFSEGGPTAINTDTSMGSTTPCHIVTRPPRNSYASLWRSTGTDETVALFQINCTTQTVVDVSVDLCLQDGNAGTVFTSAANGIAGVMYANFLDYQNASKLMTPAGSWPHLS